jgi:hypothetical protein
MGVVATYGKHFSDLKFFLWRQGASTLQRACGASRKPLGAIVQSDKRNHETLETWSSHRYS